MKIITGKYLKEHPNHIFVFGDNFQRDGFGGAAKLRNYPNTYGFITKKLPNNNDSSFFKPSEYEMIYKKEITKLYFEILKNPDKIFLISKVGSGLANKYKIWEKIIEPTIKEHLKRFSNVEFLW